MIRGGVDAAVAMKASGYRTRRTFDTTAAYLATLPTTSNIVALRTGEAER